MSRIEKSHSFFTARLLTVLLVAAQTTAVSGQVGRDLAWTADASRARYPNHTASGSLHAHPFTLGSARIEPYHEWSGTVGDPPSKEAHVDGGVLWLNSNSDPTESNAFTVFVAVKPGELVDGKTFIVPAGGPFKQTSKIMDKDGAGWFFPVAGVNVRSQVRGQAPRLDPMPLFSMRLTFGKRHDGVLPGSIYLALKDADKSFIAGKFEAVIKSK